MSGCSLFQVLRDLVVKNLSYTLVVVYLVFEVVTSGDGTGGRSQHGLVCGALCAMGTWVQVCQADCICR